MENHPIFRCGRKMKKNAQHIVFNMIMDMSASLFLSQPITFQRRMIIKLGILFVLSGFYIIFAAINY